MDLVRTTALTLASTLAACQHPPPSDPPVNGPNNAVAEVEGSNRPLPILAVPQSPASETSQWLFEPGGRRLASTEFGDCSIWDVESGRLIRQLELTEPPPPACAEWVPSVGLLTFVREPTSADGKLAFELGQRLAIVDGESGAVLRELKCPTCALAEAFSWSPTGHQLAMLWTEPLRFESWDADTGKQLRAATIPQHGPIDEFMVAWSSAGPIVALTEWAETTECNEESGDCEWDDEGNILPRQVLDRRFLVDRGAGLVEIDLGREQGTLDDLELDPEGQWVYWIESWDERRAGTNSLLHFIGLGERTSGLGWEHFEDYGDYDESMTREGQWRSDGATHWLVEVRQEDYEGRFTAVQWETTLTQPPLGRRSAPLDIGETEYESGVEVELFGFVDDAIRFAGELCMESGCKPIGTAPPHDCTVLDIGSNHGAELFDCGGRIHLRNKLGLTALPLDAGAAFWWWGRSGALAIDDGATFVVVDAASGRIGLQRTDVGEVLDGKLGAELDRLVLVGDKGFELLDLTSLKLPLRLPDDANPIAFAFSPTGDRLALLEPDHIEVLAIPDGKPVASWPIQGVDDLAFRQDGKVLYVGSDRPTAGFNAANGEPLNDPLVFAAIAEAIDNGGEIEPAWRWIMHDEFDSMVRTLDGREIEWLDATVRLPDTGQYSGKPPGPELAFRIDASDPWAVPEFDSQQLAPWLERPDLVEAFLSGQAIDKPTITPAELAALRAKLLAPAPSKRGPTK